MKDKINNRDQALKIFERQLDCLLRDDKIAQMELYAEDLRYEFPFANDRPKLIAGRKAFYEIMAPLWEKARKQGAKVEGYKYEFHETDEANLYLAVFTLDVSVNNNKIPLQFVQLIRIRNGYITEVREFFSPQSRAEITNSNI